MTSGIRFKHRLEFAALKLALSLFGAPSLERASAMGAAFCGFVGPRLGVTNRARKNLERAFPGMEKAEQDAIIKAVWRNLGRNIAEYAHLDKFQYPPYREGLEIAGTAHLAALQDKGGVFVSGHFANWEIAALIGRLNGVEGGGLYRHANNPLVNEWTLALRARAIGQVQIAKGQAGMREIIRLLRAGKSVFMLTDQKMNDGIETTFFGHKVKSTAAPAGLAVRYGVPIFPVSLERLGESVRFRLTVHAPLYANADADDVSEVLRLTQAINDFLEAEIRARPGQWFWLHNRWPMKKIKKRR